MTSFWVFALSMLAISAHAAELEPFRQGAGYAPIHSDALKVKIEFTTKWPADRVKPEILSKAIELDWDGLRKSSKGHPFPILYAVVQISIPAGAQLTAESPKPLKGEPNDNETDVYRIKMPIDEMQENTAGFFVRFHSAAIAEFDLNYSLELSESVFGVHSSCDKAGVKIVERSEGKTSTFLFARCHIEDRLLYINVSKPLDQKFSLANATHQFIETTNTPVVRVILPQNKYVLRATIGEMKLEDAKGANETYEIIFEPNYHPSRWRFILGVSEGFTSVKDGVESVNHYVTTAKGALGFKLLPGVFDMELATSAVLLPILVTSGKDVERWFDLDFRTGYVLPLNLQPAFVSVCLGAYFRYMTISATPYGVSEGVGPEIHVAVERRPLGSLGWTGYVTFAPLGTSKTSLDLSSLSPSRFATGVGLEIPWFGPTTKKPQITFDYAHLNVLIGNLRSTQDDFALGLKYPLL